MYGFPKPPEQQRWVRSLPNTLTTVVSKTIGVCAKHWPPGCKSIKIQGGADRPANPPSIFGTTNLLCFSQSIISRNRDVKIRAVTAESRAAKNDLRDKIDSWNDMIKYCTKFSDLVVSAEKTAIKIFRLNGVPPNVEFSIYIYKDFHVDAHRSKKKILVRDLINGFSNALAKFSQVDAIIARLNDTPKISNQKYVSWGTIL